MFCKACGAKMEDSHLVCQMCGTKKGAGKAFCEHCGTVRQVGVSFCQECGNKFVDDENAAPVQSASVPVSQQTPAQQFQSASTQDNSQYMPAKKFCRSCGAQVMNTDKVCSTCGVKVGEGVSYCPHCAAPVANPQAIACTSCGMSLKEPFDAGEYFKKFADNFTNVFKNNDILTIILDYGGYLMSFLTFIFSFLPVIYIYVFGFSESYSAYSLVPFCGILFLLAFLFSVARFVPHVDDFINKNEKIGPFAIFVAPALMLLSIVILALNVMNASAAYFTYKTVSCGFTFWGVLLIIFVLAAVSASVFSFLRKKGIVKF